MAKRNKGESALTMLLLEGKRGEPNQKERLKNKLKR